MLNENLVVFLQRSAAVEQNNLGQFTLTVPGTPLSAQAILSQTRGILDQLTPEKLEQMSEIELSGLARQIMTQIAGERPELGHVATIPGSAEAALAMPRRMSRRSAAQDMPPTGDIPAFQVTDLPPIATPEVDALLSKAIDDKNARLSFLARDPSYLRALLRKLYVGMLRARDLEPPEARAGALVAIEQHAREMLRDVQVAPGVSPEVKALAKDVYQSFLVNPVVSEELLREREIRYKMARLETLIKPFIPKGSHQLMQASGDKIWHLGTLEEFEKLLPAEGEQDRKEHSYSSRKKSKQLDERIFNVEKRIQRHRIVSLDGRFPRAMRTRALTNLQHYVETMSRRLKVLALNLDHYTGNRLINEFMAPGEHYGKPHQPLWIPHNKNLRLTQVSGGFLLQGHFETDIQEERVPGYVQASIEHYWQGEFEVDGQPYTFRTEISVRRLSPGESFSSGSLRLIEAGALSAHAQPDGIAIGREMAFQTPAHEFGHILGLPDEYEYIYDTRRHTFREINFPNNIMGGAARAVTPLDLLKAMSLLLAGSR